MKKRTFIKPKFDLNFFTLFIIIAFIVFSIGGCKKDNSAETRDVFTSDQLGWINNVVKPKYRCITKSKDTQGNIITTSDTIEAYTKMTNYQMSTTSGKYVSYYEGSFYFSVGYINTESDTVIYTIIIDINNINEFIVKLSQIYSYDITHFRSDTCNINGVLYYDVYKLKDLTAYSPESTIKIYFKKGIGFLYLEKANGNNATMIQ
ncbi:MAG: hypothetical protein ACOYO1_19905 [Bacteroidales bacterium]